MSQPDCTNDLVSQTRPRTMRHLVRCRSRVRSKKVFEFSARRSRRRGRGFLDNFTRRTSGGASRRAFSLLSMGFSIHDFEQMKARLNRNAGREPKPEFEPSKEPE